MTNAKFDIFDPAWPAYFPANRRRIEVPARPGIAHCTTKK